MPAGTGIAGGRGAAGAPATPLGAATGRVGAGAPARPTIGVFAGGLDVIGGLATPPATPDAKAPAIPRVALEPAIDATGNLPPLALLASGEHAARRARALAIDVARLTARDASNVLMLHPRRTNLSRHSSSCSANSAKSLRAKVRQNRNGKLGARCSRELHMIPQSSLSFRRFAPSAREETLTIAMPRFRSRAGSLDGHAVALSRAARHARLAKQDTKLCFVRPRCVSSRSERTRWLSPRGC